MADAHNMLLFYGYEFGPGSIQLARQAAEKSVELDRNLPEGHAALGYVNFWWLNDWEASEREYRRAIELDANYVSAHHWYALLLAAMGRNVEAIEEIKTAETLDPRSLIVHTAAGYVYYFARKPEDSIRECNMVLAIDPNFMVAHAVLGLGLEEKSKYPEAVAEFQKALNLSTIRSATYLSYLGHAYAMAGKPVEAENIIVELNALGKKGYPVLDDEAVVYVALGDKEKAIKSLRDSLNNHDANMVWYSVNPQFEPLRSDARFTAILAQLKLRPAS